MAVILSWANCAFAEISKGDAPQKRLLKVAILPVTVHSAENLGFIREGLLDMLSSRVELAGRVSVLEKGAVKKALAQAGEMDSEKAKKLGEALGADFVVFGSLTKMGESASLDLKVIEVKGEKPGGSIFTQTQKMEELIARVDELARRVDEKVLGYSLAPPQEKTEPARAAVRPPAGPRPPGPRPSAKAAVPEGQFWQSQPFPFKVRGMAMADFDGDGRNEVVLIEDRSVWIYRWEGKEFKRLKEIKGGKFDRYLAVDAADLEKEGKARIFVTNLQGDRLSSFVVAHRDGDYKVIASGLDWFLKVVEWGGKGPVLLAQRKAHEGSFLQPIYELGWNGKEYQERRKADVPKPVFCIYGFTPFTHDGRTDFIFIDYDYRMKAVDTTGKVLWISQASYDSDNAYRLKPINVTNIEADDMAFLNVRVIARGKEIFVIYNHAPMGQIVKRTKYFTGGEVQVLTWTGALFMEGWKSRLIPGYVADFQIQSGEGGKEIVVAANLPKDSFFSLQEMSALLVSRVPELP